MSKPCLNCGDILELRQDVYTCSVKCASEYTKKRNLEASEVGSCPHCGNYVKLPFEAFGIPVCSQKCRNNLKNRLYRNGVVKSAKGTSGNCATCGKEFTRVDSANKYCSARCRDKNHQRNQEPYRLGRYLKNKAELYESIGSCALCGQHHSEIVTGESLGLTAYHSKSKFHKDHIVPKSKGGDDDQSNYRWLCWFCNMGRSNMDIKYDTAIAAASKAFWATLKRIKE